jgi:hypothetical protein
MQARLEITAKYDRDYQGLSKAETSLLLDKVVQVTGWSRDKARRRLSQAARPRAVKSKKRQRARKYSFDGLKILQKVWAFSGGSCGKYLVVSMPSLLESSERHKEFVPSKSRYSPGVRGELLSMSGATFDRYLVAAKERDLLRGKTTTKPSTLLRSSIQIRKAGDEVEDIPEFFEGDTVAHCGPTLKGEFARTLNLTDMQCGWVFTRAIRNNASVHMIAALQAGVDGIPYQVKGLDFDNGSELLLLTAANVILDRIQNTNVISQISGLGKAINSNVMTLIESNGLSEFITLQGNPSWEFLIWSNELNEQISSLKALFMQEMSRAGVLMPYTHNISAALDAPAIAKITDAYSKALPVISEAAKQGTTARLLEIEMVQQQLSVR